MYNVHGHIHFFYGRRCSKFCFDWKQYNIFNNNSLHYASIENIYNITCITKTAFIIQEPWHNLSTDSRKVYNCFFQTVSMICVRFWNFIPLPGWGELSMNTFYSLFSIFAKSSLFFFTERFKMKEYYVKLLAYFWCSRRPMMFKASVQ